MYALSSQPAHLLCSPAAISQPITFTANPRTLIGSESVNRNVDSGTKALKNRVKRDNEIHPRVRRGQVKKSIFVEARLAEVRLLPWVRSARCFRRCAGAHDVTSLAHAAWSRRVAPSRALVLTFWPEQPPQQPAAASVVTSPLAAKCRPSSFIGRRRTPPGGGEKWRLARALWRIRAPLYRRKHTV